jgi:hypothetical protein
MEKSLNQQWKESGTTLSYKEWRRREDEKMSSFDGVSIPKKIDIRDSTNFQQTQKEMQQRGGYKSDSEQKTTLGIKNYVLVIGAIIIIGAIGYKIYKNKRG